MVVSSQEQNLLSEPRAAREGGACHVQSVLQKWS